jgi:hypothetical protein
MDEGLKAIQERDELMRLLTSKGVKYQPPVFDDETTESGRFLKKILAGEETVLTPREQQAPTGASTGGAESEQGEKKTQA